ncbi:MAG: hypothetical protein LKM44_02055, partial [Wolbachia endosymbiont of Meromenopon meropis]|nr:hypothetical protein [Wolbachia endosymbiont of Meromenopon meropis]
QEKLCENNEAKSSQRYVVLHGKARRRVFRLPLFNTVNSREVAHQEFSENALPKNDSNVALFQERPYEKDEVKPRQRYIAVYGRARRRIFRIPLRNTVDSLNTARREFLENIPPKNDSNVALFQERPYEKD